MTYKSKIASPIHFGRFQIASYGTVPDVTFTDDEKVAIDAYLKAGKLVKEKPAEETSQSTEEIPAEETSQSTEEVPVEKDSADTEKTSVLDTSENTENTPKKKKSSKKNSKKTESFDI